mgnify:CR=1 FL=1
MPCSAPQCGELQAATLNPSACSASGVCIYQATYGDSSFSLGYLSRDTVSFGSGRFPGFYYGCGQDNEGLFGRSAGLIGLARNKLSLLYQLAPSLGGSFSYCLPPVSSGTGFLALGAPSNTSGFSFTPMTDFMDDGTSYLVKLTGISVGGKQLRIPRKVFEGGLIVDCGNIISHLPATPYAKLRSAFRAAMAAYPLIPSDDDDTCYNFTGYSDVTVPKVALTFTGGVTVDLDVPNGVLLDGCLAFAESGPDDYVGFLGNVQMRTLEMLYDVWGGRLGFRAAAC